MDNTLPGTDQKRAALKAPAKQRVSKPFRSNPQAIVRTIDVEGGKVVETRSGHKYFVRSKDSKMTPSVPTVAAPVVGSTIEDALEAAELAGLRLLNQMEQNLTHLRDARLEVVTALQILSSSNVRASTTHAAKSVTYAG